MKASWSGHLTNCYKLYYLLKTQYYISLENREQIINFGQKPIELPFKRRAWSREMKRLKNYKEKPFILDEARVTQYLNLLKLPKKIINFLDKKQREFRSKKIFYRKKVKTANMDR